MENLLKESKTIAVVGLSNKSERASYQVAKYLQNQGYRIIPINPVIEEVLGEKSYPSLSEVPKDIQIDLVDIFRRSEEVVPIVEEAIALKVKGIWLQEGVISQEAAEKAEAAGIQMVMDKCTKKIHMFMD